jgi:predicted MPP superfamily phosphohydrolase
LNFVEAAGGPAHLLGPMMRNSTSTATRSRSHAARWRRAMMLAGTFLTALAASGEPVTFVFTSDLHYGLNRGYFRGAANVEARVVAAAMLRKINALPAVVLPADDGLRGGERVGPVDFAVITGDLSNRQELYPIHIQSATTSWEQFERTFLDRFALIDRAGRPAPVLLVPGNHDASNAIGSPSKLMPKTDAAAMVQIFNRMMQPATPRTAATYDYATDRIIYSRDLGGAHGIFLTIWPDSVARAWIERDLAGVAADCPVLIFCHDQPDIEAKHLVNPNGRHEINSHDKFENLVADVCADGLTVDAPTKTEQRALAAFLRSHRNVVGYFHGNSNWNEFYTWTGPDGDIALPAFRADSPIKGKVSGKNESALSFQLVTFDAAKQTLTARECLWNARGANDRDATPVAWGATKPCPSRRGAVSRKAGRNESSPRPPNAACVGS